MALMTRAIVFRMWRMLHVQILPLQFGVRPPPEQGCFPAKGQQFNRFSGIRFVEGARCKLLGEQESGNGLFLAPLAHGSVLKFLPQDFGEPAGWILRSQRYLRRNQFLPPNNLHSRRTSALSC